MYSEIDSVRLAKGSWPIETVSIRIGGETEAVIIPRNIKSKKLKADLYL